MNFTKFRSILIALLSVVAFAQPALAASLEAQENQLVDEIDRQADAVFAELARQQPELPVTIFQKTQREAVYRLRQMHVLTDILKAAGPVPAISMVSGEVLTNFVLAPMFAAKGHFILASVTVAAPWGLVAATAAASYEFVKQRLNLARDLKTSVWELREADRVREIVLGYDVKYRVSTVMFEFVRESFDRSLEFEVVSKMKKAEAARTPFVTVAELEEMVKSTTQGATYLEHMYLQRLDRELYTALMLRYFNDDPVLAERLLEVLKARAPLLPVEASVLRKHLLAVDDLKKQIARDLTTIQGEQGVVKKLAKGKKIDAEKAKAAKRFLKDEIKRLQASRGDVIRHEYALLLDVKSSFAENDQSSIEALTREYEPTLQQLRVSSRHVPLDVTTLAPPEKHALPSGVAVYSPRQCMNLFALPSAR